MSNKVEKYTQAIINIANNDSHGYSQINRWGVDYDCSSLVITVVENAGILVKTAGASYTGNMLAAFKACGFSDVTSKINLKTGKNLKRGDILLNVYHHTEIYIGNGKKCGARIDENGTVKGATKGDQTGKEICISDYKNYPWTHVLRYKDTTKETTATTKNKTKTEIMCSGFANEYDKTVSGIYIVTASSLNIRDKSNSSSKILTSVPTNTQLRNYGYFTRSSRYKWLLITYETNNIKYTGFVYSKYVEKN